MTYSLSEDFSRTKLHKKDLEIFSITSENYRDFEVNFGGAYKNVGGKSKNVGSSSENVGGLLF